MSTLRCTGLPLQRIFVLPLAVRLFSLIKRITSSKNFLPLVAVLFFAWLAAKPLFAGGYFNMHDDLQMMRQLEMEKCFADLQIPCRWVPDMGYGFGYPLFNFYPPLPYLVGQIFRVLGYSFVDTAKALFITAFFASAVTMYFFAKRFFGRLGGVLSSIFYVWAPYHAVDIYVRGAMNESWGMIWFPLILLFSYNIISNKDISLKGTKNSIFQNLKLGLPLALAWAALLTSHNLMVIIFTPFFALWCVAWLLYYRNWKVLPPLVVSGLWAFALAAFFTLPVFLEKNVVQTDTLVQGYYEFTAHFPSIGQLLISRFWGYGPSVWGLNDEMSFQVGWFHWIIPLFFVPLFTLQFLRKRKVTPLMVAVGSMFTVGWVALFMAHPKSTPIWEHLKFLQFIQFPWRYLTMIILGFSFCMGAIAAILPKISRYFVSIVLVIAVLAYSWNFFMPQNGKLGPLTDEQKFTGAAWQLQQTAGIYDYLPNTSQMAPQGPRKVQAEVLVGEGTVLTGPSGTNWERFNVDAKSDITVRIGVLAFPNWKVTVDGKDVETFIPKTETWGRLYVNIPTGTHEVYAKLMDTPARSIGNILTIIAWILLLVVVFNKQKENIKKSS